MHTGNTEVGWPCTPIAPWATLSETTRLTSSETMESAGLDPPCAASFLFGHFNDTEFIGHLKNSQPSGQILEVWHNILIIRSSFECRELGLSWTKETFREGANSMKQILTWPLSHWGLTYFSWWSLWSRGSTKSFCVTHKATLSFLT